MLTPRVFGMVPKLIVTGRRLEFTSAGDEGEGVGAATFCVAPRPSAFTRHAARTRRMAMTTQDRRTSCLPSQMLGYDQPRDSHVHGVAFRSC